MAAPRQSVVAEDVEGTIELFPGKGFEHALSDVEGWGYLWVLFVFHLNEGWRPKVLPPRSTRRRGVFATRSPHRPNPIGLSAVRLEAVEGLTLRVRGVDMVDGSPVLDLKPYVPYADSFPEARVGWLSDDQPPTLAEPGARRERLVDVNRGWEVELSELASAQLGYLRDEYGVELTAQITQLLSLGPQPHPYRRIRAEANGALRLALKDWRVRFVVEGRRVLVQRIDTGYRPSQLAQQRGPSLAPHQGFVARFGPPPPVL